MPPSTCFCIWYAPMADATSPALDGSDSRVSGVHPEHPSGGIERVKRGSSFRSSPRAFVSPNCIR
eukprot:528132-Pyramimonas_sp.AAC.1